MRPIRVLFLPYARGNPYQKLLAEALKSRGVDVKLGSSPHLLPVLKVFMKKWKPDILHIHWQHSFIVGRNILDTILRSIFFTTGLILLKLLGIRIVWTVHNIYNHEKKFVSIELFFTSILAKIADRIFVHCRYAKHVVMRVFRLASSARVVVIPHGNYIPVYENKISRQEARRLLGIQPDNIVFLYFGLIRPYKGVFKLINAFKKFKNPRARLFIVGKPADKQVVKKLVEETRSDPRIRVVPRFIPDNEVQIYMNAADTVVLPYETVLSSGTLLLAMSFCKPVIAPRIGCIPEVLSNKGGILYDPRDPDGLTRSLHMATTIDFLEAGRHNYEEAEKLDWNKIGLYTYKTYCECLAKH